MVDSLMPWLRVYDDHSSTYRRRAAFWFNSSVVIAAALLIAALLGMAYPYLEWLLTQHGIIRGSAQTYWPTNSVAQWTAASLKPEFPATMTAGQILSGFVAAARILFLTLVSSIRDHSSGARTIQRPRRTAHRAGR